MNFVRVLSRSRNKQASSTLQLGPLDKEAQHSNLPPLPKSKLAAWRDWIKAQQPWGGEGIFRSAHGEEAAGEEAGRAKSSQFDYFVMLCSKLVLLPILLLLAVDGSGRSRSLEF